MLIISLERMRENALYWRASSIIVLFVCQILMGGKWGLDM